MTQTPNKAWPQSGVNFGIVQTAVTLVELSVVQTVFLALVATAKLSVGQRKTPQALVMAKNVNTTNWLLGIVGGIVGGAIGYFAFFLMARQGLYAMVLPGALLGLGCGFLSGIKSNALGVVCGLIALLLGFFTEWQFAPFIDDGSFAYFVTHVHSLKSMTLVMIAVGGLFGYWFGRGRAGGVGPRRSESGAAD